MTHQTQIPLPYPRSPARSLRGVLPGTFLVFLQLCLFLFFISLVIIRNKGLYQSEIEELDFGTLSVSLPSDWWSTREERDLDSFSWLLESSEMVYGLASGDSGYWWSNNLDSLEGAYIQVVLYDASREMLFPGQTDPWQAVLDIMEHANKQVIDTLTPVQVHGSPAAQVSYFINIRPNSSTEVSSPLTLTMLFGVIFDEDRVIEFRGLCPPDKWLTYQPVFEKVFRSINFEPK